MLLPNPSSAVVYLAGCFPLRSETFVYREVRALRRLGRPVEVVSLYPADEADLEGLSDLRDGVAVVYGRGALGLAGEIGSEAARHPLRVLATMGRSLADAVYPSEPLSWPGRLKLIVQATAGIAVAGRLRQRGVGHVHCHFAHAPTSVGMYAAHQLGVPFSFTGHANDIFQRRALLRRKLQRAAFVACISEWHREFFRSIWPGDDDKYRVIRCGVETEQWALAARGPWEGRPIEVVTVCRLVEKKGVDTLIRGLCLFGQGYKREWKLTVAGDGPERNRLEALGRELGCAGNVQWLGAVGNDRVRRLLGGCDVFALACRTDGAGDRDGIPVVLMEAMACGVPVVAGDLPAIRELVQHDVTGLLFDGQDASALAGCLGMLDGSPERRGRLAAAGRRRVEEEFSLERNVARLEAAFLGVKSESREKVHEPILADVTGR